MKIVFMGTPWFSVPTLENLLNNGFEVVAVYTQPDREAGRGRTVSSSPIKRKAVENNIAVEQPENFKNPETIEKLKSYQPDAIVVYSFGQILPQTVLDVAPLGCINVHPSLLPKYRGAAPVISAVLGGDVFTGVTIMKMALKLDAGDILMQSQVQVADYDTAGTLTEKLSSIASQMVPEVLPRLAKGEITPRVQDDALATYCGQLTKQDGEIDWNTSAEDIWRRIRAFNPWPGCYTTWKGKQVKIAEAKPVQASDSLTPGQIISLPDRNMMGIGTADGVLGVMKLQLQGKKLMAAGDFMRGQRELEGDILPS